jgi:hypothetical protein
MVRVCHRIQNARRPLGRNYQEAPPTKGVLKETPPLVTSKVYRHKPPHQPLRPRHLSPSRKSRHMIA